MSSETRGTAEVIASSEGAFFWSGEELTVSSGAKRLLRGNYRHASGVAEQAILTCYEDGAQGLESYANELSVLSRNSTLGIGPRLLAPSGGAAIDGFLYSLIQEDAGEPLDLVLFEGAAIPAVGDFPREGIASLGSEDREVQNAKILFDVFSQVLNLHKSGRYHRDLRAANICVKRCGGAPGDIRATIVDFDLASGPYARGLYCNNEYFATMFERLPGVCLSPSSGAALPTPFEMDSAYLQALSFELQTGKRVGSFVNADCVECGLWPLYRASDCGKAFVRRVDQEFDLDVLAKRAGVHRIDESLFADAAQLAFVDASVKHGGYLDALDLERIEYDLPETEILSNVEDLARRCHERYNELMSQADSSFEAVAYEDLRGDLLRSNREQARSIPEKVAACGYRIVRLGLCDSRTRIEAFSDDEVEYLSALEQRRWVKERKKAGWTFGPEKDAERFISPYLVSYEDLPEGVKERNRRPIRDIIPLLESMGLAVCR